METAIITNETVLSFVLRVILGILFFFQGYDKVFNIKISGVISYFRHELGTIKISGPILTFAAWFTSFAELICGALLIIGLFKTYALYILAIDLILVAGAFSLINPVWDMKLFFPRLILLSSLLFLPAAWDLLSMDYILSLLK